MAGAVMNPVQVTGSNVRTVLPSDRISAVVDRLVGHVRSGGRSDVKEIDSLCRTLSRSIDDAVVDNEIPEKALQLPTLLKQVYQLTNDRRIQIATAMLMISLKGACRNGWFSEKDTEELHRLWIEISTRFCSVSDMTSEESTFHHSVSTIFARFYPRMKMGEILAFTEAMPGYGAFVKDFHIAKNASSLDERVYLFVAQTDNTETSSCITTPQLVNFLVNGKAVDGRTYLRQDPGPQIPTLLTHLVKPGTNLLQAVGQFNGPYIIVVAFMSMVSNPSCTALPDYMPPVTAASDSDNDIVEGPSIISLNCPISFKRITTPVKGLSCKHRQCVDFDNYVDINSRRPSWRCPHCSQSVCFTDIRIDQGMAKVLKEVDVSISHVKFSADGSWKDVNEGDDHAEKQEDKLLSHQKPTPSDKCGDIMDLTKGDNDVDATISRQENNEKKPPLDQLHGQPSPSGQIPSHVNTNQFQTNTLPHMDHRFFTPTQLNGTSSTRSNFVTSQGETIISGPNMQLPTHVTGASNAFMNPILQGQSQTHMSASSMQFQQHSMSNMINDYGLRYTTPNRHMPRTVQPHPAQNASGMVSGDRHQFSRFQMDQHNLMNIATTSFSDSMGSQNWAHHDLSHVSIQPSQQFSGHLGSSHQSSNHYVNSHQHQSVNHMIPNLVQSPAQLSPQVRGAYQGLPVGQINNQFAHHHPGHINTPISNQQSHHYLVSPSGPVSNQQSHHYVVSPTGPVSNQQTHQHAVSPNVPISNQQTHHYGVSPTGPVSTQQQAHHYAVSPTGPVSTQQQGHHYVASTTSPMSNQLAHHYANTATPRAPQISSWTPPIPAPLQTSVSPMPVTPSQDQRGLGQAVTAQEGSANASGDQNWRPTGLMRGSLSGQAYSAALSEAMVYPAQPVLTASPPALNTPRPFIPPHLQALIASNITTNGFEDGADGTVLNGSGGGAVVKPDI